MKQYFLNITLIALAAIFSACAPVYDDIFTNARISVTAGDNTTITDVQAQVKLTNLNSRQVTTVANFEGNTVTVELLRGAYQINIEGVAACLDSNGTIRHRQFRCQSDYAEFAAKDSNEISLNIIFLD